MKYKYKKDKTLYVDIDGKNYKVNIVYDKRIKKHRRLFAHDHIVLRLPEGTPDQWVYDYFSHWKPRSWVKKYDKINQELIPKFQKEIKEKNLKLEPKSLDELKQIVEKYIDKYEPRFGRPKKIYFKEMYEAWGDCSSSKDKITFNILLMYFPEKYIEHIVYHEMIHMYCLNHNPPFYREMVKVYPDWKEYEHDFKLILYLLDVNELYLWKK